MAEEYGQQPPIYTPPIDETLPENWGKRDGGGGGTGTDDYNDLSNKPKINGTTLEGNRTLAQIGAASTAQITTLQTRMTAAETSASNADTKATQALTAAADAQTKANSHDSAIAALQATSATKTEVNQLAARVGVNETNIDTLQTDVVAKASKSSVDTLTASVADINTTIGDKADLVPASDTLVEAINKAYNHGGGGGGSGTSDYTELENKPSINDVTLQGNKTLAQLGVASAEALDTKADTTVTDDLDTRVTALENAPVVNPIQMETMPTASGDYNIVQFVGTTDSTYTKGFFYRSTPKVVSGELTYSWEQIDVQPSSNDYEQLVNKPSVNGVELTGDKTAAQLQLQSTVQYVTMPEASAANLGQIVQYVGATTLQYSQGYWYQCVYNSEDTSYGWQYKPVTIDISSRVTTLEQNQGDITQLPGTASTIVDALVALSRKDIKTFSYTEPNLIITYNDDSTSTLNVKMIIDETQLGELANVMDTTIADTNVLQYDAALQAYKPYAIVQAMAANLQAAKDYADQAVSESVVAGAFVCDAKPEYDAENDTVIYKQDGVTKTTTQTDARFYYHDSQDQSFCSSWINDIEFTFSVAEVEFSDYVKVENVVSSYTGEEADKTKVPNLSALDTLVTLIRTTYIATCLKTTDVVDALTSQDSAKVLSANQGYVLKALVDNKQDIVQYSSLPAASSALVGVVYQTVPNGKWWRCEYAATEDVYAWVEIKYSPTMDTSLNASSTNPVTNAAITAAVNLLQPQTLSTPITVDGVSQTTVEGTLNALNNKTVDVDTTLDDTSDNPIANSAVATAVDDLTDAVSAADTNANSRLKVVATMPATPSTGDVVLYVGATGTYTQGGIYLYDGTDWNLISTAEVDLSDYKTAFTGTTAQWNALTSAEKAKYEIVNLTDDVNGGTVVSDAVTSGDLNPVTSNAVYNVMTYRTQNFTVPAQELANGAQVIVEFPMTSGYFYVGSVIFSDLPTNYSLSCSYNDYSGKNEDRRSSGNASKVRLGVCSRAFSTALRISISNYTGTTVTIPAISIFVTMLEIPR